MYSDSLLLTSFPCIVWHISHCGDHDKASNQRQVHETDKRNRNHWEQVLQRAPYFYSLSFSLTWTSCHSRLNDYHHKTDNTAVRHTVLCIPSLHSHLVEHLNAEIVLHTISDANMALDWIRSTFLYIRALKNPKHYGESPESKWSLSNC